MIKYTVIIVSTFISAIAQYSLKIGVNSLTGKKDIGMLVKSVIFNIHILTGLFLYTIGAILWLYVLSKFELSKAYPLASLGYVFSTIIGYLLLNESLSIYRLLGIGFIITGVYFISNS
ncbi:putative 4-amino-4-deoxy-L-arabinose-phosphoundecaprenol flippase subunit ArnF [termite gut metagenome]|uniref:Putative 4-amino-4-deoxy-L-arabinose-phosphoundecaprenol flippase subunit ArnF n=1 Tax=termite gut metagenome TaxID=433724 RepID=A0A5J4RW20_9ZZZZ